MSSESLNSTNNAPIAITGALSRIMQSKMEPTPFAKEKLDESNNNSSHQRNTVSIISANAAIKSKMI